MPCFVSSAGIDNFVLLIQRSLMFDGKIMADMTSMLGDVGLAQRQVNRCI